MLEFLEPLHPKLVHFPIALIVCALVFEVLNWIVRKDFFHHCALSLYVFAALISPLVVRTGLWEAERIGLQHPLLDQHQQYALWTMWLTLMSLPLFWFLCHKHRKIYRVFFVLCVISVTVLVTLAAHKGGQMVYEYGVGTEAF